MERVGEPLAEGDGVAGEDGWQKFVEEVGIFGHRVLIKGNGESVPRADQIFLKKR
jgi:hypothetical protein